MVPDFRSYNEKERESMYEQVKQCFDVFEIHLCNYALRPGVKRIDLVNKQMCLLVIINQ